MSKKIYMPLIAVMATAMNRLDYNSYRGWDLPCGENGSDEGYLIERANANEPNHKNHSGYISWLPKSQFDDCYEEVATQDKVEFDHVNSMVESLTFQFARIGDTTTTVCEAFLPNGFSVGSGKSACVDPANYNFDDGCKYAKENAVVSAKNTIWQLEGYLLKVTGKTSDKHKV